MVRNVLPRTQWMSGAARERGVRHLLEADVERPPADQHLESLQRAAVHRVPPYLFYRMGCVWPARRATAVDPLIAMRAD
jgi:hypothetical protein